MNKDWLNILSGNDKDIDNQRLMDYLSGKLTEEARHEVEKTMADSEFLNDAVEGLQQLAGKKDIQATVDELNAAMRRSLAKKKERRLRRRLREDPWTYLAIILVIGLCILAFVIIRRVMLKH
jgi:anti-sigma factor RsiW